jgi:predicted nucleotidyltransferase
MRLTPSEVQIILDAVHRVFGNDAEVMLFGSRTDDRLRGGDIDLLIRPASAAPAGPPEAQALVRLKGKLRVLGLLEQALGERRIDLVIEAPDDPRPIVRTAHETGMAL